MGSAYIILHKVEDCEGGVILYVWVNVVLFCFPCTHKHGLVLATAAESGDVTARHVCTRE